MTTDLPTAPKISVIGAGAWGTSLARHLANKGFPVRLWAFEPEVVEAIQRKHENTVFLPGVPLPASLMVTGSMEEAVDRLDLLIFAVPSHAARSVLRQLGTLLPYAVPIISATKGIEKDTFKLISK